jgi:DNA-binding CsgD family transcriptional regulator
MWVAATNFSVSGSCLHGSMETSLRLLTHNNLQRLNEAIGALYMPVRPQQLTVHFARILKALIPGEFYGVSTVIRSRNSSVPGRRETALYPIPADWERLSRIFATQYVKFPLRSIRESGNLAQPLAISDVASRRKFESLELYHDYYRILGVADDLSVNFGTTAHRTCLAVLRGRRGFSKQDRAILTALRPHVERAYHYSNLIASFSSKQAIEVKAGGVAFHDIAPQPNPRADSLALRALGLSEREAEVLYWVAAGKSSPVIGMILGIHHDTVRSHLKKIYAKLGVENRMSAALHALQILTRNSHAA